MPRSITWPRMGRLTTRRLLSLEGGRGRNYRQVGVTGAGSSGLRGGPGASMGAVG